jgi:hypothetical protein
LQLHAFAFHGHTMKKLPHLRVVGDRGKLGLGISGKESG